MQKTFCLIALTVTMWLAGCNTQVGDYVAASSISEAGYARDVDAVRRLEGQEVKLWGYVDPGNLYGDEGAKLILGEWWSGEGPDESTWRFNMKANAGDATGQSFAVYVSDDAGRDELLRRFVADATAGQPTQVFIRGRLQTFDAPANMAGYTGLSMQVKSSQNILLALPEK